METNQVKENIVKSNRPILQAYGQFFGSQIYRVKSVNHDLNFKEDLVKGRNGLRRELKICVIEAVDIASIDIDAGFTGGDPQIVINKDDGDAGYRFPLVKPDFKTANQTNIREALDLALNGDDNKAPIFFATAELENLTKHVEIVNKEARATCQKLASHLMSLCSTIDQFNDKNKLIRVKYLQEMGMTDKQSSPSQIDVNVNIDING